MGKTSQGNLIKGSYPDALPGSNGKVLITVGDGVNSSGEYNVTDFADFNTLIDEAVVDLGDDGGTIRLLLGDYTLSADITIPTNVSLVGSTGVNIDTGQYSIIYGSNQTSISTNPLSTSSSMISYYELDDDEASSTVVALVGSNGSIYGGSTADAMTDSDVPFIYTSSLANYNPGGVSNHSASFLFTGSEAINCGSDLIPSDRSPFSIECWVKYGSSIIDYTSGSYSIFGQGEVQPGMPYTNLLIESIASANGTYMQALVLNVAEDDATDYVKRIVPLPSFDEWHHIVATWDGTTTSTAIKIYVDGIEVDGYTEYLGTVTSTASALSTIGARAISNTPMYDTNFVGKIDNFITWDKVLTYEEVFTQYSLNQTKIENVNIENVNLVTDQTSPSLRIGSLGGSSFPLTCNSLSVFNSRFSASSYGDPDPDSITYDASGKAAAEWDYWIPANDLTITAPSTTTVGSPGGSISIGDGYIGKDTSSFNLDGSTSYFDTGIKMIPEVSSGIAPSFSISAWIWFDPDFDITSDYYAIFGQRDTGTSSATDAYFFRINHGLLELNVRGDAGAKDSIYNTTFWPKKGEWVHVACTFNANNTGNGTATNLYFNGQPQSVIAYTDDDMTNVTINSTLFSVIGVDGSGSALHFFPGKIDNVVVYTSVAGASGATAEAGILSDTDVLNIYNAQRNDGKDIDIVSSYNGSFNNNIVRLRNSGLV